MNKEYYGVLFHYNTYTNKWNCFKRDCFNDYFKTIPFISISIIMK